jgi:predicted metal-dependent phosphoesterase TrpH
MLKAALHVHSTYSDGEFTLTELKQLFSAEGCSVVGITDHAQSFDPAKLADYVSECKSLSDDRFLFLCGLEFGCEQQMHMLGYGATATVQTQDPQEVIRHIEENQGLAVIAHPKDSMFP